MKFHNLRKYRYWIIVLLALVIILITACNSGPEAPTSASSVSSALSSVTLSELQQNNHLAVSLSAFMTFAFSNNDISSQTELMVPPIPITWTGSTFAGHLEESGPGEDVTEDVSGSVSSDAKPALSLVYWRQIIRPTTSNGTFYRVTLRNVPVMTLTGSTLSGAGIQNLIAKIEYNDGPLTAGKINPTSYYKSTDWITTVSAQKPNLKIIYSK